MFQKLNGTLFEAFPFGFGTFDSSFTDRKNQLTHQNREMRFYIVDAFSNVSFKGNPAAVVLVDKILDESEYLEISGEFNLR